ncbi:type 1 glutamine amidotransferase [Haloplanus rubicundus]|uniref:Type 1 glutamine amidotransferase n=1 Tax=Haloplanus rubicundus TaxID=1547898 RepID=A0A345E935_9EURY|nr:type 1 glutamine amidotransferase [Haloplanus rubicundus]AXG08707.1 type 1 glutamine amidotransferase [Haloplanus rubicundus]
MTLRLALLDASHGSEHTRPNFRRELDAALAEFDVTAGELPSDFAFDGVVVTGSSSSVYWDEPWIDGLVNWVAEAADRGLPILGVCYGHQVLAEALGGRVEAMADIELGYRLIDRVDDGDPLLDGLDDPFTAFETHSDRVVELPTGATLLAENDRGVQAFRRGDCWGVQFHPEYDEESAERVTRGKDLPAERIEAVVDDIDADNYAAACRTKRLFDNFTDHVRARRATSPEA